MIKLNAFHSNEFVLNDDKIEKIEEIQGSTTITLINGNKYIVIESADEIIERVIDFRSRVYYEGLKNSNRS